MAAPRHASEAQKQDDGAFVLPRDCTLREISTIRDALLAFASERTDNEIAIDCRQVDRSDLTLLQLLVSANNLIAARGKRIALGAVPDTLRGMFDRAGLDPAPLLVRS